MISNNNEFYQNSMINARKDNDEWKNAAGTCSPELIKKNITENGTYTAASDNADGYSSVTVNVPSGGSAAETQLIQLIQRTATSINIPSGTTIIGDNAFSSCFDLTSVTIPNTVTKINMYAFGSCNSLQSVEIPSSVIEIEGYAFEGCEVLSSLTLNEGIVTIGRFAFCECAELTSVEIPSTVTSLASDAFDSCSNITSIIVHKAQGSLNGAPWGATNATVTWDGE